MTFNHSHAHNTYSAMLWNAFHAMVVFPIQVINISLHFENLNDENQMTTVIVLLVTL